ncbi:MAG: YgiW/YdeI family stress tolerance OB fold protein [Morganella morganii]|nr:YgiW/YdeI family stress tolerance OB fold protein [Morganella morganii]HDU8582672.1 YgiW/YdeI family stress tolerance OB fold protein [Morganella morganii]
MKKLPALALLATLLAGSAGSVFAANGGFEGPGATAAATTTTAAQNGGFSGPDARKMTVADALKLSDDAPVVLRGTIVRQLDNKHYEFKDSTGTIRAEISPKRWGGLKVTPQDEIEVEGEIDKEWNKTELDVKAVRKVQ